nr:hypothetical protein [uncultured Fretibacterium sp.]
MAAEPDLFVYLTRVLVALGVLSVSAFVFVRCAKKKNGSDGEGVPVRVLTSLPVGKDVFFVVRCGPDVLAFTSGGGGSRLMGRWTYEDWMCSAEETPPHRGDEGG